jgi:hypothetical protein
MIGTLALGVGLIVLPCLTTQSKAESGVIPPILPGSPSFNAPRVELSPAEKESILRRMRDLRERLANEAQKKMKRDVGKPPIAVPPTSASARPPEDFLIGRNSKNTQAEVLGESTIAEPAAINRKKKVFAAGNFNHAEYSTDHGVTWVDRSPPGGPADAPIGCCDNDAVIDDDSKIGLHSFLYINGAQTNGIVRIFVRPKNNLGDISCFYDIDPAGAANNIVPDYPHIALTDNFAYLSINAMPTPGTGFARMYRFDLSQMLGCQMISFTTFDQSHATFGPRVWVPGEGANNQTRMLWVQNDSASVMRIFDWPEAAGAPSEVTRTIQTSNFANPDCRGGTGNFDFIEVATAFGIFGSRHRCAVAQGDNQPTGVLACYWNAGNDGTFPQGLVRSAVFSLADLGLLAEPHIWSDNACFGYPAVTSNTKGDIGLSIASGGKAGGGGTAAQGYVGIDDQFTPGTGVFETIFLTASGVANRSDGRYGDYVTIHPYQTCDKWFGATSYAWDSAPVDAANDVNSRWVEFGRKKYENCYLNAQ